MASAEPVPTSGVTDSVCVVTGGASGIGSAISEALLSEGASVAVIARDADRLADFAKEMTLKTGSTPLVLSADVADEKSVTRAFATVVDRFGCIDSLVNNAGITKVGSSFDFEISDFRHILDVNVTGLFICSQIAGRYLRDGGGGSIVNIASMASFVGHPERAAYVASKSAVAGLTRSLAVEWGGFGIRVNGIAPGYIRTDLVQKLIDDGTLDVDTISARTPQRRLGIPNDLVGGALYLLGSQSAFTTGQILRIDGGWTANGYYK